MAEGPAVKPVLQKPPGYRDPAAPRPVAPKPPPRRPQLPPTFRQPGKAPRRRRRHFSCCRLCCWLLALALALAFLLTVAGGVAYLWFQPRLPSFRLQSVQASRFRVATRSDGTFLDATTAVRILASNPNGKIGLAYGDGEGRVTLVDDDGDVDVGTAAIAGFVQRKKNATVVRFLASAKGVMVDDAVGSRLKARFRNKEIRFAVEVRTKLGFRVAGKTTGKVPIRVLCGAVSLRQVEGGRLLPRCRINLLRW
uniref:NDR1/HIN1-like protein 6 n=1 Tax=Elaeis guineensis var. tenera TaxID=51953 RepID=A0A6I9QZS9_ELAGV|nr:NDR1/HIN1-like protein 6 [Elaeis guineensis]